MDISGDGSITLDRRAFKALASETRVEILKRLDGTQKTVSDLARELDMNKATMFQHLEQLVEVGLVKKDSEEDRATTVKEGPNEAPVSGPPKKWVYYRLSWKGKNVLHPERVKIAIMLSIVVVGSLLAISIYVMLQGTSPAPPEEKDRLPPMVVSWDVDPARTDSGMLNVRITVQDNVTGKVSGLDGNATVLRWGVATDSALVSPDLQAWDVLDWTLDGDAVRARLPAGSFGEFAGRFVVLEVRLKDRAGNAASYRFSERVAPAAAPEMEIVPGSLRFSESSWSRQFFVVEFQVRNSGQSGSNGTAAAAYGRDPDVRRTGKASGAVVPAGTGAVPPVAAGAIENASLMVDTDRLATRSFFIMVDINDTVTEANEGDNVVSATIPPQIWFPSPVPPAKGTRATPGMEAGALAVALAAVALLAWRRRR
jgi:DNA-binding transcriptional ArsR family regulator